jgi:hypothetical protein
LKPAPGKNRLQHHPGKARGLASLNVRTVQKIEAGQTNILITTAKRIQAAIGCSWESLLD